MKLGRVFRTSPHIFGRQPIELTSEVHDRQRLQLNDSEAAISAATVRRRARMLIAILSIGPEFIERAQSESVARHIVTVSAGWVFVEEILKRLD